MNLRGTKRWITVFALAGWPLASVCAADGSVMGGVDVRGNFSGKSVGTVLPKDQSQSWASGKNENALTALKKLGKSKSRSPHAREGQGSAIGEDPSVATKLQRHSSEVQALEKRGIPVKSIGAIIDSSNPNLAKEVVLELIEAALSSEVKLRELFILGGQKIPLEKGEQLLLAALQGGFKYVSAVPERFPVKTAPTWLLETEEGMIIMEGEPVLSQHLNSFGEVTQPDIVEAFTPDAEEDEGLSAGD